MSFRMWREFGVAGLLLLAPAGGVAQTAGGAGGEGGASGGSGAWGPCGSGADCAAGQSCTADWPAWPASDQGYCYDRECEGDGACEAPFACDLAMGLCDFRDCAADGDCPSGQVCGQFGASGGAGGAGGSAGPGGAGGSGGIAAGGGRVCIVPACLSDADCGGAERCDPESYRCEARPCSSDAECPDPAICRLTGSGDVASGSGGSAGAGGVGGTGGSGGIPAPMGTCFLPECFADADCGGDDGGRYACVEGSCRLPACESQADCLESEICAGFRCMPRVDCQTDADCGLGEVCMSEGYCLDTCLAQGGCGGGVPGGDVGAGGRGGAAGGGGSAGVGSGGTGGVTSGADDDGSGCSTAAGGESLLALALAIREVRRLRR